MNPILHAIGQVKPVHFGVGRVVTTVTDRDNLCFNEDGSMVIGSDGLPKIKGLPRERVGKRKYAFKNQKPTCADKIVELLKQESPLSSKNIAERLGYSRPAVNAALNRLARRKSVIFSIRTEWKRKIRYYCLSA